MYASGYIVPEAGSMVVSEIHWSSSSSSSLLVKEGTMALLYFGHVSIHLDHSNSCVLNIILLNLVLKCVLYNIIFGLFYMNLFYTLHKAQGQHQHFWPPHCQLHSIVSPPNLN